MTRSESHIEAREQTWPHEICQDSRDAQVPCVSRRQGTTARRLSIWCRAWYRWGGGEGGGGGGGAGLGREPGCGAARPCMLLEACVSFFSLCCFQPTPPPRSFHAHITHSHVPLPFNSQLGVRKLECWGELHRENTSVTKMKRRGRGRGRRRKRRRTGKELGLVHAPPYHAHQNFSFK